MYREIYEFTANKLFQSDRKYRVFVKSIENHYAGTLVLA